MARESAQVEYIIKIPTRQDEDQEKTDTAQKLLQGVCHTDDESVDSRLEIDRSISESGNINPSANDNTQETYGNTTNVSKTKVNQRNGSRVRKATAIKPVNAFSSDETSLLMRFDSLLLLLL